MIPTLTTQGFVTVKHSTARAASSNNFDERLWLGRNLRYTRLFFFARALGAAFLALYLNWGTVLTRGVGIVTKWSEPKVWICWISARALYWGQLSLLMHLKMYLKNHPETCMRGIYWIGNGSIRTYIDGSKGKKRIRYDFWISHLSTPAEFLVISPLYTTFSIPC